MPIRSHPVHPPFPSHRAPATEAALHKGTPGAHPGPAPETRAIPFRARPAARHDFLMSNTAARWTLIAALAVLTLLTITITTRLDGALDKPAQSTGQSASR
ncbi:hypothetical protein GCM10009745_82250 [Kribbella yunnanensis]|uniref:Uncharacterized protein n=1 Tax=Kribbella yunnanensis TaxID=190194 RepID=A0ABN2J9K6_9ACTN